MAKVNMKKVISAMVAFDNSTDEERVYDISLNANINATEVSSVDNGEISKKGEGEVLATFNGWGNSQNFNYNGLPTLEKNDVNIAVDDFLQELASYVKEERLV